MKQVQVTTHHYVCETCKKETIEPPKSSSEIKLTISGVDTFGNVGGNVIKKEMCVDCGNKILQFIDTLWIKEK